MFPNKVISLTLAITIVFQIGDQSGGHPLPGFLSDGLRQLLSGCLRMEDRLSAKDCVYLTVCSEASNNEQERKVVEKLECK